MNKTRAAIVGIALLLVAVIAWLVIRSPGFGGSVNTDNAYVQGNVIQITPQVAGTVLAVRADDTEFVHAGQPLVQLDPADAKVALEQAEAQLAQTVREVRILFANNDVLGAQVALREADIQRLESDLSRARVDAARRESLVADGAVGSEEFEHSRTQFASARSALAATRAAAQSARAQLAANQSLTDNTSVEQHPNVQRASARVREAFLALRRADVQAPVDGFVARRSAQVGQRVQAGSALMTVVPLDAIWVDANFKENQLRRLRVGQPATLVADIYGGSVRYHGTVAGLGAGTGAAFALLPAQNATGNWIKVVQRVPVRIRLDAQELAAHPLRIGLSVDATVDVSNESGQALVEARPAAAAAAAALPGTGDAEADAVVGRIILENSGRVVPVPKRSASTHAPA